jgi:calcium-dependent protein kinase
VKIYELIETSTRIYVIQEYLSGGILYDRYSESTHINESLAAKYFSDIILALNCIHKFKIVHRDVKPTNLMFESDAPDSHIKLIDFGISILQKKQSYYGDSVQYMAPETILNAPTTKSDIWSAGTLLYSMLTGEMPFTADSHEETATLIKTSVPKFAETCWQTVSAEAQSLVRRMLSKNPKDRPTAEQILSDPWIMQYNRSLLKDDLFSHDVQERIGKMNASINLEKSIFSFISNQVLNAKDLKKLKDLFKTLDKDGSQTLTVAELNSGYDALGLTPPASIIDLMKKLDTDDSGSIDYYEFLKGSEEWAKLAMKKELDYNSKKYEKGSDAKLSLLELKGTIPDIQGTEWFSWLTNADKNGDGYITLEELRQFLAVKLGF